jgi:signal transduction histidine kinase
MYDPSVTDLLLTEHAVTRVLADAAGEAAAVPVLLATLAGGLGLAGEPAWLAEPAPGLAAEAWERGAPVWDDGGVAFPVRAGGSTLAVIALPAGAPGDTLLATLESVGAQIGQFLARCRVEAELRESEARRGAILEDDSERHASELALRRLADEQAALRRVATAVAAEGDPGRLFELVSAEVGRLLGAETAHLIRYDDDGEVATIVGGWAVRDDERLPNGAAMRLDSDTAATRVWKTGRPARMDDYSGVEGSLADTLREFGVRSVVIAPVSFAGSLWGAVIISTLSAIPFPEGTEQRLADFAELAAQALANAQAREDAAASRARIVQAGDAERRRLERNLHDGAQQRLVSLLLLLRIATRQVSGQPEAVANLERGTQELVEALHDLRELARGIHPAILTERGLEPAVEALIARAPLPVDLEVELDGRLPAPVEAAAYYVVAEALTNVARYARASGVRVLLAHAGGRARIEVADDGVGGADALGSGLRGLADRVEALNGRFAVVSPAGGGTTVRAEIPLGR